MPDLSLAEFAIFMARAHLEVDHAVHVGLEKAARVIEAEARAEIGNYQGAAAQFGAWPELAEATKADRRAQGFTENDPLLRTGELRDSIDHVVGHNEAAIGSNSEIAVYQELGTSKIPPRSFLGGAAARKAERVAEILGHSAAAGLFGRGRVEAIRDE